MDFLRELLAGFGGLFATGGALWFVFLTAVLLWALVIERYWYFSFVHPEAVEIALRRWKRWAGAEPRIARRMRRLIVSTVATRARQSVSLIRSLLAVTLLTGVLGAVGGVMRVLQAMSLGGPAGQVLIERGIAAAAVPAVAAGTVALVTLFFSRGLEERAVLEARLLADRLRRS
jgi:biopolymer transport protein ExbB